jgi:hypothetical protein
MEWEYWKIFMLMTRVRCQLEPTNSVLSQPAPCMQSVIWHIQVKVCCLYQSMWLTVTLVVRVYVFIGKCMDMSPVSDHGQIWLSCPCYVIWHWSNKNTVVLWKICCSTHPEICDRTFHIHTPHQNFEAAGSMCVTFEKGTYWTSVSRLRIWWNISCMNVTKDHNSSSHYWQ